MQIFGKKLCDFKKPLLILVVLFIVCSLLGVFAFNYILNLGGSISCDATGDINYTQSELSGNSENDKGSYKVDVSVNNLRRTTSSGYVCQSEYIVVGTIDSEDWENSEERTLYNSVDDIEGAHYEPWDKDVRYGYSVKDEIERDRFVKLENGSIIGVGLFNDGENASVRGLEKGDTLITIGQANNGNELMKTYTVR